MVDMGWNGSGACCLLPYRYSPDAIQTLELVISDANKPKLLANAKFVDYLLECLLLDSAHHLQQQQQREDLDRNMKWLQQMATECFAQLATFPPGCAALREDGRVKPALRTTAEFGRTKEARKFAHVALVSLYPTEHRDHDAQQQQQQQQLKVRGQQELVGAAAQHVMLSYSWAYQDVIKRLNRALKQKQYVVWIDVEKMQGSTIEAMADAVEQSAVVCYGISRSYKESVNCRMEAQYAYRQQKDMVPLMMEEGYRATGWLGMILGVRLWYQFCGKVLASDAAFETKVNELCRELGERGQVPPAPEPEPEPELPPLLSTPVGTARERRQKQEEEGGEAAAALFSPSIRMTPSSIDRSPWAASAVPAPEAVLAPATGAGAVVVSAPPSLYQSSGQQQPPATTPLSEGFLLQMERERNSERAERAAERAVERERAAEREREERFALTTLAAITIACAFLFSLAKTTHAH
jgi:hypothetical protein